MIIQEIKDVCKDFKPFNKLIVDSIEAETITNNEDDVYIF